MIAHGRSNYSNSRKSSAEQKIMESLQCGINVHELSKNAGIRNGLPLSCQHAGYSSQTDLNHHALADGEEEK